MSPLDTPMIHQLESYLSVLAARQMLIAGNMANIDTPGYRTQDLNFQQALLSAESGREPGAAGSVYSVNGLLERPDGNNVNLDRESFLMAQTQLQFSTGVALLRDQFQTLQSAINGGGSGGSSS